MSLSKQKNILFLMSGSIAAYKSCHMISQLVQDGHKVQVVTTPETLHFVGPMTLEGLTGNAVLSEVFAHQHAMAHINWARWADLIILCPATANTINKMASGIGDDLVTTLFLAHDFSKPFLVAPAMNTWMYQHPTTKASLERLQQMGLTILPTGSGPLACGENGYGRLLEPETILQRVRETLSTLPAIASASKPESKGRILITSGGTFERIDAMRVLTNLSTGQTGAQIAEALFDEGFQVDYLGAQSAAKPSRPCRQLTFTDFQNLHEQLKQLIGESHYIGIVHAAAVSDFHIAGIRSGTQDLKDFTATKLPSQEGLILELAPNFKILPRLKGYSHQTSAPSVVGFKYTASPDLAKRKAAVDKLFAEGGVDLVVHNDQADIDKTKGLHSFTLYSQSEAWKMTDRHGLARALADHFNKKSKES